MKKIISNILVYPSMLFLNIKYAFAQNEIINPLGADTFEELLVAITNFLLIISIPIVSIMVLYGGFQILTAAGTPEKIEKGKKTIIYSVVGFVVILLANGVALIIKDILGVTS